MTVAVPIENNGQPGEGDIVIPVSISAPSPGATLGSSSTADVVIQDNNPLSAPVTVTSLQVATAEVTVGSGKKTKTKTEKVLRLQFSGPITGVGNLAAYQLLAGKTTKTKRGKVTTFSKPVALAFGRLRLDCAHGHSLPREQTEHDPTCPTADHGGVSDRRLRPPS